MARHVFYSLHYDADRARVAPILGSHALEAQLEAPQAEWAKLKRSGDFAIKRWLENQLKGRSCLIVLIGAETASRAWVQYEIQRAHALGLGLFGIHVHALKDALGKHSSKGPNPFEHPACGLGSVAAEVPVFDPPDHDSKPTDRYIVDNLARWADQAVAQISRSV
jgi:hypothetical protein